MRQRGFYGVHRVFPENSGFVIFKLNQCITSFLLGLKVLLSLGHVLA